MKVLVTGGTGFIASHTIDLLKSLGHKVITNVRNANPRAVWLNDVDVYMVDIRDKAGMYSLVEKADGVIHLAGLLGTKHIDNAWNFYDVNVQGVLNILDACKDFKTPFVGIGVGNYWMENNYANSKYAAEREILKYAKYGGVKANVVRGLNAIGERQKVKNTGKIMATFITNALKNEPIEVYGGKDDCGLMDMVYVGDVAKVLTQVLFSKSEYGNVYEAGTGKGYSVYEIAEMVKEVLNSKSEIIPLPMRSGEDKRSIVVAKNPYPIEYMKFAEAMARTIKYYKENL